MRRIPTGAIAPTGLLLALAAMPTASATVVTFTNVTTSAGVSYIQHDYNFPPDCLLEMHGPEPPKAFMACAPERFSGAAAVGDYDGDGLLDLFATRLDDTDLLFRNKGDGTFEDASAAAGLTLDLPSNGAGFGDIDNDGDLDLYVTTLADERFYLYINDGAGRFTEEARERGVAVENPYPHSGTSVTFGDYNRDGWLDIYVAEWRGHNMAPAGAPSNARMLRNRGIRAPGRFDDVTAETGTSLVGAHLYGEFGFAPAFVDLDRDGWLDLAVVSDMFSSQLFWNERNGTFTDGTVASGVGTERAGMGSSFGDYDGDGDLDWFVSAIYDALDTITFSGNRLHRNEGGRLFTDATDDAGVRNGYWGWGGCFFDYDNDGDLDLVQTNGMEIEDATVDDKFIDDPVLLWNNEAGVMTETAATVGLIDTEFGKGLVTFDYDADGDLDIFIANNGHAPSLWRNDGGNAADWLRIEGCRPSEVGAYIEVIPNAGDSPIVRDLGFTSYYQGQSEHIAHVGLGLGPGAPVDEVRVTWVRCGRTTTYRNVARNTTLTVCPPADVQGLKATKAASDVALRWTTSADFATGYDVYRATSKYDLATTCTRPPHLTRSSATPAFPVPDPGAIPDPTPILFYQVEGLP